ncbi:Crp/Fnr family transcriptional regulator [Bauldia sp.]|uniref:Crp/Fnr family transcriptional regulator n=1 Tax=Bauldia sp. TaxID=2575872 RepID=UPI003BAC257B
MKDILDHCERLATEQFEQGTIIIDEGGASGRLIVLEEGVVEVLRGDTTIARIAEPGSIFGEMSVLLDRPYTATVRAATPVSARVTDDAARFMSENPTVALAIAKGLAQRLNAATTYLVDIKRQYQGQGDHLSMVSEVLDTLIHHQDDDFTPGSDREPDPMM